MLALVSHDSITTIPDSVVTTITNCLGDNFPEVKRQCCLVVVKLCKKVPEAVVSNSEKLLKALVVNCSHQHSKTRQMSIKAIGFVCVCGAPDNFEELMKEVPSERVKRASREKETARSEATIIIASSLRSSLVAQRSVIVRISNSLHQQVVLPCFKKCSFDRVPSVRKALITGAITKLATIGVQGGAEIKKVYETFVPDFLSFFLLGVSDGTPEVEEVASDETKKIAKLWREVNGENDR